MEAMRAVRRTAAMAKQPSAASVVEARAMALSVAQMKASASTMRMAARVAKMILMAMIATLGRKNALEGSMKAAPLAMSAEKQMRLDPSHGKYVYLQR